MSLRSLVHRWIGRRPKIGKLDNDTPLISIGKHDHLTIGDSFEGVAVLGASGSGKTSSSGFQLALAMLRLFFGALVLTAKIEEVDRWRRLASLAGRSEDLVIFDEEHSQTFNFLSYLASRQSQGNGVAGTLMMLIEEVNEGIERISGLRSSRGDEQYWKSMNRLTAGNAIELCQLGVGEVSIPFVLEILRDAPRSLEQARDPQWQADSVTFQLIERTKRTIDPKLANDLREIEFFFMQTYAGLAEKTRSIIDSNLLGVLNLFAKGTLNRLFCHNTSVTPDDIVERGKIVVVNLPIKQFYGLGYVGQTIWKAAFQQRAEQRTAEEQRPCLLYMDEAQNFLGMRDMHFAATARSSRVCNFWLTQNLSNVLVAFGGDETGKAAADSLLGLATTKIFHSNSDPLTNQWAADLIGRRKVRMRSSSIMYPNQNAFEFFREEPQVSCSSSQSLEFIVQPHEFSMLQKGGPPSMQAEAIVTRSGKRFRGTGESFCRVFFDQGF